MDVPRPGLGVPRISPDGRRVVACAGEWLTALDLWLFDVGAGGPIPFARSRDQDMEPFWWNEGRSILWTRQLEETRRAWSRPLDGAGEGQFLFDGAAEALSRSGQYLLLRRWDAAGVATLGYVAMTGDTKKIIPVPEAFRDIRFPTLSPDDRWLAYHSEEGGSTEVYLVDFPGFGLASRRTISRGGGRNARWHPDGSALFYLSKDGRALMPGRMKSGGPETEDPTKVFDLPESVHAGFEWMPTMYDVASDGERFLMLQRVADGSKLDQGIKPNMRVVLNWFEKFRGK